MTRQLSRHLRRRLIDINAHQSPLRVKRVGLTLCRSLQVYLEQRTQQSGLVSPVEALLAVCGGLPCHQLSGRNPVNKRRRT